MKKNKLIPFLLLVMLVALGVLFYVAKSDNKGINLDSSSSFFTLGKDKVMDEDKPIDGDLPRHTLGNIAKDSRSMKKKIKDTMTANEDLKRMLATSLENQKKIQEKSYKMEEKYISLNQKLEEIKIKRSDGVTNQETMKSDIIEEIRATIGEIVPDKYQLDGNLKSTQSTDYEVTGGGLEEGDLGVVIDPNSFTRYRSITLPPPPVLIDGKSQPVTNANGNYPSGQRFPAGFPQNIRNGVEPVSFQKPPTAVSSGGDPLEKQIIIDPRYTIFSNSILTEALTVTYLVGRIPKNNGKLADPAPFKVLIGKENLSANGFNIPNLDGMIMSGIAYGDGTLRCVRTKILSATYIFEDGRGITFPSSEGDNKGKQIGWLSDEYGDPCIKGTYHTNAGKQLTKSFLTGMAIGATEALASAETTTSTFSGASGTSSSTVVDGNATKYALSKATAGGLSRVQEYLQRQSHDSWDAIRVSSGMPVNVHIDVTLELDQTSLQRRVSYESNEDTSGYTD